MANLKKPGADAGRIKPATYDIYCRKDGRWRLESCFLNEEADEALAEAKRLDAEGGFDGVRLMHTLHPTARKGPVEVMVWVSPRLVPGLFGPEGREKIRKALGKARPAAISGNEPPTPVPPGARPAPAASGPVLVPTGPPPPPGVSGPRPDPLAPHRGPLRDLGTGLLAAVSGGAPLEPHVLFGLHLLLAGYCEAYAAARTLTAEQRRDLIHDVLAATGTSPERARTFLANLPDYPASSRYRVMIETGRDILAIPPAEAAGRVAEALRQWKRPTAKGQIPGIVTVMFTDIVGSTRATQEKGDIAAQEMVRTHNGIVRNALAAHDGHEVKHTGDGIMASFPRAGSAVEAAMEIQRRLARHNAAGAGIPFEVRIGLNCGEPVHEEDDIFGAVVQIAARACAAAGPNEILATGEVRDLTAGYPVTLIDKGPHRLKGIDREMHLYAVVWNDQSAAESIPPSRGR